MLEKELVEACYPGTVTLHAGLRQCSINTALFSATLAQDLAKIDQPSTKGIGHE